MKRPVSPGLPHARNLHLPALLAFDSVARHMNFARAADEFGITPTAMSKTIKLLESQLGARLFNRTTRSVALTEAGTQLLDQLGPALEQIRRSVLDIGEQTGQPRGTLRINTSYVAYASLIEAHVAEFLAAFPEITLELVVDNGLADIVAAGFDAGIRLGHALQRDMVGLPMGTAQQLVVVAAPSYLQRRGTPGSPEDLLEHECIRQHIGNRGRFLEWQFRGDGEPITIAVTGRLIVSEMRCALSAAAHGHGLAWVFERFAAAALQSGEVVELLGGHGAPAESFYLYYPHRAQMPGKLRAFADFIRDANRSPAAHV